MDGMTSEHKTHYLSLEPCGACAMYDDALTQERDHAHSSVRVDVLCVEVSGSGHVAIGVGIVVVQRLHASITYQIKFSLLVHFCTCRQAVCCDRQFFPVAISCTLLHRENLSFEVLCLQNEEDNYSRTVEATCL